jgi:hypothetical protein
VYGHHGAVPSKESKTKHIPDLLEAAIKDANTNVTAVARKWAEFNGTKAESKRRLLQKYLKGESVPDEPGARQLSLILRKPGDHFVTTRARVSRRDLDAVWKEIGVRHQLVGELSRALGDQ